MAGSCYIDFKFNSVPRDHEKFAFTRPLVLMHVCTFCDWERTLFIKVEVSENNLIIVMLALLVDADSDFHWTNVALLLRRVLYDWIV